MLMFVIFLIGMFLLVGVGRCVLVWKCCILLYKINGYDVYDWIFLILNFNCVFFWVSINM